VKSYTFFSVKSINEASGRFWKGNSIPIWNMISIRTLPVTMFGLLTARKRSKKIVWHVPDSSAKWYEFFLSQRWYLIEKI
jgi:hypothetical protein